MKTKKQNKKTANVKKDFSIDEKAQVLNMCLKYLYSATPDHDILLSTIILSYGKDTNILWDSYIWRTLGIYHREYTDYVCGGLILSIDVIKIEKAIDKDLAYYTDKIGGKYVAIMCNHVISRRK